MVRKCARACIVSGALIGMTIPDTPIVFRGQAKSPEVRKLETTPCVPQRHRCLAIPVGQEFTTSAPPLHRADSGVAACALQEQQQHTDQFTSQSTSTAPQSSTAQPSITTIGGSPQRSRTPSSSRRRHLGSFAMTAYTQYHSAPRRTASGSMPAVGRTVAVDPRVIPLGTKLHIEGVGVRIAEDTGRKIRGKELDLYLSSIGACSRFGVRARNVYILD